MKTKGKIACVLGIGIFFVLSAVISQAQSAVCTSRNTNIRRGPNTNTAIVRTVPANTTLNVIGRVSIPDSTKFWYRVGIGEYMASWVRHGQGACAAPSNTDAQRTSPTVEQPAAQPQIDNYCQTTWTCTTNDDWVRGYHAYQDDLAQGKVKESGNIADSKTTVASGQPVSFTGQTSYEFLGEGELTVRPVVLTSGIWDVKLTTSFTAYVDEASTDPPGCAYHRGIWIAWKLHDWFGGGNVASGKLSVLKDCSVSFYVWGPRHSWSLKVNKV